MSWLTSTPSARSRLRLLVSSSTSSTHNPLPGGVPPDFCHFFKSWRNVLLCYRVSQNDFWEEQTVDMSKTIQQRRSYFHPRGAYPTHSFPVDLDLSPVGFRCSVSGPSNFGVHSLPACSADDGWKEGYSVDPGASSPRLWLFTLDRTLSFHR